MRTHLPLLPRLQVPAGLALAFGLALQSPGQGIMSHAGLPHAPVGAVSLTETGGVLDVSGVNASGSNGVSIALGDGRGWRGDLGPLQLRDGDGLDLGLADSSAPTLPLPVYKAATEIRLPANPATPGLTIQGTVDCYACPHKPAKNPPIPMGQMQLMLFDQANQFVDSIPLENGVPYTLPLCSFTQTVALTSVAFLEAGHGEAAWRYCFANGLCVPPQPMKLYPPIYFMAVQWVGLPDPPPPGPQHSSSRTITVLPKLLPGNPSASHLQLGTEFLQGFGHFHQALGQAGFDAQADALGVSGLGTNGNDGVSVQIPTGRNRLSARWRDLDPAGTAQPGAGFTMSATGDMGGSAGGASQALGSMRISQVAGGMNLVNDFTGIGSQSALILVMRNGSLVASFRLNHNTPLPISGGWPRSGTVGPRLDDLVPPYGPICFYEDWPIDVTVFGPGGQTVSGNQIRVLVDDVAQPFVSLSAVDFALGGLPRFDLTGEESAQAGLIFNGLVHAPLGDATLQIDASAGGLRVSGIGSNGTDGLRIMTGGGGGGTTSLGVFNPDVLPIEAFLHWAAIDPRDQTLLNLSVQRVAAGGAIFADFTGLGAPTATVALYSNDVLVAFAQGIPPTIPLANFSGGGGLPLNLDPCILHPEDCWGVVDINIWQPDPIGPVLTLPGSTPLRGTRLQIVPEVASGPSPVPWAVQRVEITGRNLGTLNMSSEGLVYFGLEHRALGQAEYSFDTPSALAVGNLGAHTGDGVDVVLPKANTYSADWVALNPQPLPPGGGPDGLTIAAIGRVNGGAEQSLGSLGLLNAGTNVQIVPDFSALGSHAQRIELWRGCTLVSSFPVPNATPALTATVAASGVSIGAEPGDEPCGTNPPPPPFPWWWLRWSALQEVTTPAGAHFDVDRVRVSPDDVNLSLDALTHVSFQMPGPQRLVLTGESASRLGLNFDGNQHFALGQATLTKTATGDLLLENIGASGADGVEIALGNAGYCEVASPSLPLPPPSGKVVFEYRAVLDGLSDRTAATLTMQAGAAGETLFTGDMSPLGATRYTLLALDGGVQVASTTNRPDAAFGASSNLVAAIPSLRCDILHYKCFIRIKLPKLPGNPGPLIRLAPGVAVIGDEVLILPEDLTQCAGLQNRLLITGRNLDSLRLTSEKLGQFGNGHVALGAAELHAAPGELVVDHLGSTGNGGVQIDLADSSNALVSFAPLDPSAVQGPYPQPWVLARAFGRVSGVPDHDLGSLRFIAAPGGVQIEPDFTPVGGSTHTIEVWRGGQLVQRVTGHAGVLGTVNTWPAGLGWLGGGGGFNATFTGLMHISVSGGQSFDGDELRVLTEIPSVPIENVQSLGLLTVGFDSFTITEEVRTPALTPRIGAIRAVPGGVQISVPTVFGFNHTLEAVSALGPQPVPWTPVTAFLGDGSVKIITLPVTAPQQFFRLRVE